MRDLILHRRAVLRGGLLAGSGLLFGMAGRRAWAAEAEAIAALEAAGASVRKDKAGMATALTFRESEKLTDGEFNTLAQLPALKSLTFYGKCLMTHAQAAMLARLPALEELAANGTCLTDPGFRAVAGLKSLKKLTIWHLGWNVEKERRVTGAGFAALAELPALEHFNFAGSTVTDAGLEAVSGLKQVRSLVLYHTWTTDAGLAHLAKMQQLRSIDVGPQFSMRIGDAGIAALATLPNLEEATIQETILTWEGSLVRFKALKQLKTLKLQKVEIRDEEMERLKAELPQVKIDWTRPSPEETARMRKILADKQKQGAG